MKADTKVEPGYMKVLLTGSIDAESSPGLELFLLELAGVRPLVLDFSNVDYISSSGLRVMLIIAGEMKHKGGELLLFGLNESVHEIFSISGFDTIIRIYTKLKDVVDTIVLGAKLMSNTETGDYGWDESLSISLYDKIKQDLKKAMLAKENGVRDTLRLIMGEYPKLTVNITLESGKKSTRVKQPGEITNDDLQDIIRSLTKSERVILEVKKKETSDYYELLKRYLPQMADREVIVAWIEENIDFSKFKSPMQAMGSVMKHFGKLADGNLVKEILMKMNS